MNSKFLYFLFVLACAAFISLGALGAQSSANPGDAKGSAMTAPAGQSEASMESQMSASAAIANDRDAVLSDSGNHFHSGWVGLLGLLGLFGLFRRNTKSLVRRSEPERTRQQYSRTA
jgi:MYXO-CTERM domain-containing protein